MSEPITFEFDCTSCGERHVGVPAFCYDAPAPYDELDEGARRDQRSGLTWERARELVAQLLHR